MEIRSQNIGLPMQASDAGSKPVYRALDGWRGICALLVAVMHLPVASHFYDMPLLRNAHLRVDFFFVLSGFVIACAYHDRVRTLPDACGMIWRRIARLWPLHGAVLFALVALELFTVGLSSALGMPRRQPAFDPSTGSVLAAIPTHLVMLNAMGLHAVETWNVPAWSISAEFWTCVIFAGLLCLPRRLMPIFAVTLVAGGAAILLFVAPEGMNSSHDFGLFRCLLGFFAGYFVYRLRATECWFQRSTATAIELGLVVLSGFFICYAAGTAFAYAAPVVFGFLVWIFAQEGGAVSAVLKTRAMQRLGAWSYSIYMIHALVVTVFLRGVKMLSSAIGKQFVFDTRLGDETVGIIRLGSPLAMDLVTLAYLGLLIVFSALSYACIEKPGQAWMLGKRRSKAETGPATAGLAVPTGA